MAYDDKLQELMDDLDKNPSLYQEQSGYQAWRDLLALGVDEFEEKQELIPSRFTTKEKNKRAFGGLIEPEKAKAINETFKKSITEEKPQKKNLDAYIEQMSVFFRQPSQETDFQKIFYSLVFDRVSEEAVSMAEKGGVKKASASLRRLLAVGWGHKWPEAQIFLARLDKKKLQELGIYNKETLSKRRIQASAYFKNDLRDKRLDEAYRLLQLEAEKDWKEYLGENEGGRIPPQGPENGDGGVPPTTPTPENGDGGVPPTTPTPENGDGGVPPTTPAPENGDGGVPPTTPTPENGKQEGDKLSEIDKMRQMLAEMKKQLDALNAENARLREELEKYKEAEHSRDRDVGSQTSQDSENKGQSGKTVVKITTNRTTLSIICGLSQVYVFVSPKNEKKQETELVDVSERKERPEETNSLKLTGKTGFYFTVSNSDYAQKGISITVSNSNDTTSLLQKLKASKNRE